MVTFTSQFDLATTLYTATRAVLEDITVPENVGNVTISVLRLGDLNQRSRGTLTYRLLGPGEARGRGLELLICSDVSYFI